MGVHDHEQRASSTHSERDEALFTKGVKVFSRERVVVGEYGCRFGEGDAVLPEVSFGFLRIPIDVHVRHCMDKRRPRQVENGALLGRASGRLMALMPN